MQGRNRDTRNGDVKNGLVDTVGKGGSATNGGSSINIFTLLCVKWIVSEKLLCNTGSSAALGWPRGVGCGEGRDAQVGGDIHVIMTGFHCCMTETNKCKQIVKNFKQIVKKFK